MKTKSATTAKPYVHSVCSFSWQPETLAALEKLRAQAPGTVAERDALFGLQAAEPLLVMMDAAIRYAKAYRARFEGPMGEDYMAKPEISGILSGIRGFLNFDGGASMERDVREGLDNPRKGYQDSKDNGMIESLYWTACEIAGLDGDSL